MTTTIVDGVTYDIPTVGARGWGQEVSDLLKALGDNSLLIKGGSIPLTSDADFGANFGLISIYYKSRSASIADDGVVRLANTDSVAWRNGADDANLTMTISGDELSFDSDIVARAANSLTLTNKTIDAASNTISNLDTTMLAAGVLNTDTGMSGASDTQVPSALAIKTYVDDAIDGNNDADEINYTPTTPGDWIDPDPVNVQEGLDKAASRIVAGETSLTNHEADTSTHGVTEILGSSEAQAVTNKTVVVANNTITTAASGNLISTELNAALAELQTDIDTRATDSDLTTHENDTANPHSVTATQVGLGNVDNTSDLDKPISTATQTALDLKADESVTVTGDESGTTGGGDLTANRTISLRDNPVIPGTAKVSLPSGTTAQRPVTPSNNLLRHNSDTNELERYNGTEWTGVGGGGLAQREAAADPSPAAIINSSYLITGQFGTFTLPAIGSDGEILYLKRGAGSDFDGTPMTVTPDGADTIGGDASLVWDDADVDLLILTSNGTDWELTTTISPSATIATETPYHIEYLTSNIVASGSNDILALDGLVVGKTYRITASVGWTQVAGRNFNFQLKDSSNAIINYFHEANPGVVGSNTAYTSFIFTASDPTIKIQQNGLTGGDTVSGRSGTTSMTYLQAEELVGHVFDNSIN